MAWSPIARRFRPENRLRSQDPYSYGLTFGTPAGWLPSAVWKGNETLDPVEFEKGREMSASSRGRTAGSKRVKVSMGMATALTAAALAVASGAMADSYEPNDSRASAKRVKLGGSYSSAISTGNDVDLYLLRARAGTRVRVGLSKAPGIGEESDGDVVGIELRQGRRLIASELVASDVPFNYGHTIRGNRKKKKRAPRFWIRIIDGCAPPCGPMSYSLTIGRAG